MSLRNPLLQEKIIINIENVVATATLNQRLDLKKIIKDFPASKYDPGKFPGVIIRLEQSRAVILAFKSGNIVCTGTVSEEKAISAIQKFVSKIRESISKTSISVSDVKI